MIRIEHDVLTGEIKELEMTSEEIALALKETEENEKLIAELNAEAEAKTKAKALLLSKLGITEDEAKLLFS